jgi:hypothetical protein
MDRKTLMTHLNPQRLDRRRKRFKIHLKQSAILWTACFMTLLFMSHPALAEDPGPRIPVLKLRKGKILITPLLDIRSLNSAKPLAKDIETLSLEQKANFLVTLRKTLANDAPQHDFVAYGAEFDEIAKLKSLKDMAQRLNAAKSLEQKEFEEIGRILDDFQYLIFFSFTGETIDYQHSRQTPEDADGFLVENIYTTRRLMSAKIAIWDIKYNQIERFIEINPTAEQKKSVFVKTEKKVSAYKFGPTNYDQAIEPDRLDRKAASSLQEELALHRKRFPSIPGRDPEFSNAIKALNPSSVAESQPKAKPQPKVNALPRPRRQRPQADEFEDNFRMELSLRSTVMGVLPLASLFIGAATLKWKIFRLGGGIDFTPLGTVIDHEVRLYNVYNGCLCFSGDLEWELGSNFRIQTGGYYGVGIFTYKQSDLMPDLDGIKPKGKSDGYTYKAPRVRFLWGSRQGAQFGIGAYQHIYHKLENPELVANHPAKYGIELTVAAASGG